MSSKNRVEQALGMAPSPQVSPGTTRGVVAEQHRYGANGQIRSAQKRGYYTAFAEQMADEEMVVEEEIVGGAGGVELKKRRLTMDQVRFLESSFESENRLEPDRKVQIAQRLGLQPRQVAVWFQNRRARSKSKQLERDFLALKADYDAVLVENEKLQAEVDRLTAQLREGRAAAADRDIAEEDDGQHLALTKDSSPKTSASSSSNSPSFQSDDHAQKPPPTATSAANADVSIPDEHAEEQQQQQLLRQPCAAILADFNVNVNLSAAVVPLPLQSTARDCGGYHEASFFLGDDFHCLGSFVQQACAAHQLVDLCADAFLYDNSLFVNAVDDPWVDS